MADPVFTVTPVTPVNGVDPAPKSKYYKLSDTNVLIATWMLTASEVSVQTNLLNAANVPAPPGEQATWNPGSSTWTAFVDNSTKTEALPLATARIIAKGKIDATRATKLAQTIVYNTFTFDVGNGAEDNITAIANAINAGQGVPSNFTWRDTSNVDRAADNTFMIGLSNAIANRRYMIGRQAFVLKAKIDAATDNTSIIAITWGAETSTVPGSWNKTSITANNVDVATFGSSLPSGTQVFVESMNVKGIPITEVSVTDGSFSLRSSYPGTYRVHIRAYGYLDYDMEITAA